MGKNMDWLNEPLTDKWDPAYWIQEYVCPIFRKRKIVLKRIAIYTVITLMFFSVLYFGADIFLWINR